MGIPEKKTKNRRNDPKEDPFTEDPSHEGLYKELLQ